MIFGNFEASDLNLVVARHIINLSPWSGQSKTHCPLHIKARRLHKDFWSLHIVNYTIRLQFNLTYHPAHLRLDFYSHFFYYLHLLWDAASCHQREKGNSCQRRDPENLDSLMLMSAFTYKHESFLENASKHLPSASCTFRKMLNIWFTLLLWLYPCRCPLSSRVRVFAEGMNVVQKLKTACV
jgi:hypothetical protein